MRLSYSGPSIHLTVRGLGCQRGGRVLFSGLDLDLAPGDLVTLTGANGSGKSTLMRMLSGLSPVEEGNIAFSGGGEQDAAHTFLHYHGHREGLRDALTAHENLVFATTLLGGRAEDAGPALERMGARRLANLPVRVLSAGQRRRVALARLLAAPRPLWLLDEPLAALDVAGQALVAELVGEHVAAGGSALVATHQPMNITGRTLTLGGAGFGGAGSERGR